ncbi:MAG: hypothetical protein ACJATI_005073 [Halioglobus sp.]
MKEIVFGLILVCFLSCKEKPNYNPFDDQFDVSIRALGQNNCDTISAGCGYFNLSRSNGRLRPYYQVFREPFDEVDAKGFTYYVDTIQLLEKESSIRSRKGSLLQLPFNTLGMNQ